MLSHELGFLSSWKMLTRDKGWIKPVLVLTLVSWIPILGQIAVLGYGLEWARLTAWGVDSAPKQHGVKYGKVLSTGGIAFLVGISMSVVLALVNVILFGGVYVGAAFPLLTGYTTSGLLDTMGGGVLFGGVSSLALLLMMVVNLFFGTLISAAMMRATLYDSFSAGWRLDRLFQMVGRDLGGFFHTYAVSLIGGMVSGVASLLLAVVGALILGIGTFGLAYGASMGGYSGELGHVLLNMGAFPILVLVVLAILAVFAVQVIGVAMQLVAINATGQWFCRFEVNRWGVSSAPLPDDVPRDCTGTAQNGGFPAVPMQSAITPMNAGAAPSSSASAAEAPAPVAKTVPEEPAAAQDAPEPMQPADVPVVDPAIADEAARVAAEQMAQASDDTPDAPTDRASVAETPSEDSEDASRSEAPVAEKKPIPLGPISDGKTEQSEEDGPIQV